MAEVLPGYEITSWIAMIVPANMKADLVAQVNALTVKALADPLVESAVRRPWRHVLAARGDQGVPRQRRSAALADHEGGRDQAGVNGLRLKKRASLDPQNHTTRRQCRFWRKAELQETWTSRAAKGIKLAGDAGSVGDEFEGA
jgi:hypothetical protein